ncbi:FAD-binding and (Fe-S)-binding domain-containing protein [Fangia hongkongensis]|uniref:FAD-binding and (Fe-S)-binding domain-containing protein n=3 Tax=Fangia hongkongensis TaxID=270495 RepID=UPI000377088E|nr:FAD-binding and (Fe-S)-binding domain-containing protein [Fangia hongkongensis]
MSIKAFIDQVKGFVRAENIITDEALCFALSTDASVYRLIPKVVIFIETLDEVKAILLSANNYKVPITFRAAGTSLSGQAVSDSVLVVLKNGHWREFDLNISKESVCAGVGWVAGDVNKQLAPFGYEIGPDPASIDSCKIGGIVANNSSGMCCGVAKNTYHTMQSIKFTLANRTEVDTASKASVSRFQERNQSLLTALAQLADEVKTDVELTALIKNKFSIKNTTGYALNALVDYQDPIDILSHLLIGSEGTLGFVSAIEYQLQKLQQYKAAAFLMFDSMAKAAKAVKRLQELPVETAELMDSVSLKSVLETNSGSFLKEIEIKQHNVALLIETKADDKSTLLQNISDIQLNLKRMTAVNFVTEAEKIQQLWNIRKGILPAVGGKRKTGSSVVIEDVAVHLDDLPLLIEKLHVLFQQYHYQEACIFGHALAGNLHFVFTPIFNTDATKENYKLFMEALANVVVSELKGSLKAEHGTGRNVAPFVELEWGEKAYSLMWRIKNLLDPNGILNPDVLLSKDPEVHLKHLKEIPATNTQIDKCMECGFCESACPTRNISLTPRQRIAAFRYAKLYDKDIKSVMSYPVKSCVMTSLCKIKCPVDIDTGNWLESSNYTQESRQAQRLKKTILSHSSLWRGVLATTQTINKYTNYGLTKSSGWLLKKGMHSLYYPKHMPNPLKQQEVKKACIQTKGLGKRIIYFPSCINEVFGGDPVNIKAKGAKVSMISLMQTLDYDVTVAKSGFCCGKMLKQKGESDSYAKALESYLYNLSEKGQLPIVTDMSSCALEIAKTFYQLKVQDTTEFIYNELALQKKLHQSIKRYQKIALHISCSTQHLGQINMLKAIAKELACEVVIPLSLSCCGFAGDRGFSDAKINQFSLMNVAEEISGCEIGITTNRTCQIGLNEYTKVPFYHLIEVLNFS